jgi:hypothetical protein
MQYSTLIIASISQPSQHCDLSPPGNLLARPSSLQGGWRVDQAGTTITSLSSNWWNSPYHMNWTLSIVSKLKDVQKYTHEERLIAWTRVTEIWHFILADCILERRGRLLAIVLVLVFVFDPQPAGEKNLRRLLGALIQLLMRPIVLRHWRDVRMLVLLCVSTFSFNRSGRGIPKWVMQEHIWDSLSRSGKPRIELGVLRWRTRKSWSSGELRRRFDAMLNKG